MRHHREGEGGERVEQGGGHSGGWPLAGDERLRSDRRVSAALAALFWKWTAPVRLWSNQKPNQRTEAEGVIDWPPRRNVDISLAQVAGGVLGHVEDVLVAPRTS